MYLQGCLCGGDCQACQRGQTQLAGMGFNLPDLSFLDNPENSPFTDDGSGGGFGSFGGGMDVMGMVELGTSLIPGVGPMAAMAEQMFAQAYTQLSDFFHIGSGRHEADLITGVQNDVMAALDKVTKSLNTATLLQLQDSLQAVRRVAAQWKAFVQDPKFVDGRASEQALNTVMPYLDGSCGYNWPPPMTPTQYGCVQWGDGTPGGVGSDGMIGAIARAITRKGGAVPPPNLTQGGAGSIVPSLNVALPGYPALPQAGTVPQHFPPYPIQQAGIIPIGSGGGYAVPLVLGVAAFLFLSSGRSKVRRSANGG